MPDIQYDSQTGERLPADWRTPKTVVSDMTGFDMGAFNENLKTHKVDEALKATEAAIQFQGQRGYQQALKDGLSAEKAITKYGPMMFYRAPQAFAPSVRALSPPSAKDQAIHVGQGLYRLNAQGKPETIIPPPEKPEAVGRFVIEEPFPGQRAEAVRISPKAFAAQMNTLPEYARTNAANVAQLRASGFDEQGRKGTNAPISPPLSVQAAAAGPVNPVSEIRRFTKDGRAAIFDSKTKQFLRYATD